MGAAEGNIILDSDIRASLGVRPKSGLLSIKANSYSPASTGSLSTTPTLKRIKSFEALPELSSSANYSAASLNTRLSSGDTVYYGDKFTASVNYSGSYADAVLPEKGVTYNLSLDAIPSLGTNYLTAPKQNVTLDLTPSAPLVFASMPSWKSVDISGTANTTYPYGTTGYEGTATVQLNPFFEIGNSTPNLPLYLYCENPSFRLNEITVSESGVPAKTNLNVAGTKAVMAPFAI